VTELEATTSRDHRLHAVTATISNHRGATLTGEIRCWMGRRVVEIETPDGTRHIGRLIPDRPAAGAVQSPLSAVDAAR
jgi:hypothetical protein